MKTDNLQVGDRIEVYRNLHKDCFSVRKNGIVVKHVYDDENLYMKDVKFAVQPAGRAKVLKEKRKNVHAFVRGTFIEFMSCQTPVDARAVCGTMQKVAHYKPYKFGHFFTIFGGNVSPIHVAHGVTLHKGKVYVNQ